MEKLVRSCDKEYMRMAMLEHEQTFKEQVYELHRLYRIQKILMKTMEARGVDEVREAEWLFKNAMNLTSNVHHHKGAQLKKPQTMKLDLEQPSKEHISEPGSDDGMIEFIDETEIELTLGPSSYNNNRRNKKKIETPLTSDSGNTLSSSSTGSSNVNKTRCQSGTIRESFDDDNNIEEQLRPESLKKQPPWFFHQVLNLSMT